MLLRKGDTLTGGFFDTFKAPAKVKTLGTSTSDSDGTNSRVSVMVTSTAPLASDTHVLVYDMFTNSRVGAFSEGETKPTQSGNLTLGQPARLYAAGANCLAYTALPGALATNAAVVEYTPSIDGLFVHARKGDVPDASAPLAKISAILGETVEGNARDGDKVLIRATLTGVPVTTNEGIWRSDLGLKLVARKGFPTNQSPTNGSPALPATVKYSSFVRWWTLDTGDVILLAKLGGTGVSSLNNTVLMRILTTGEETVLMRSGDIAPDCPSCTVGTISRVDVDTRTGDYVVLATLGAADVTSNLALFHGDAGFYEPQARLLLRKGTRVTVTDPLTTTFQESTIASMTLFGAQAATGAGNGGTAIPIGNGKLAVQLTLANLKTVLATLNL